MLSPEQINRIHRLHFAEQWSIRKIARHLHIGRRTIAQYLATPARTAAPRQRASKLLNLRRFAEKQGANRFGPVNLSNLVELPGLNRGF